MVIASIVAIATSITLVEKDIEAGVVDLSFI
jgi:hypothetical protein